MSELRDERRPGWWWAHDDVIDHHARAVGSKATLVYMALCRHANKAGQCWPSVRRVSDLLGVSPTTVKAALTRLVEHGLIRVDHRTDHVGRHESNLYTLLPVGGSATDHASPVTDQGVGQPLARGGSATDHEGNTEKETQEKGGGRRRKKPATPLPDSFEFTEKREQIALAAQLDYPKLVFANFKDHHAAIGSLFSDWDAAWRKWCRKEWQIQSERRLRSAR